jgi:hypothetical protein
MKPVAKESARIRNRYAQISEPALAHRNQRELQPPQNGQHQNNHQN